MIVYLSGFYLSNLKVKLLLFALEHNKNNSTLKKADLRSLRLSAVGPKKLSLWLQSRTHPLIVPPGKTDGIRPLRILDYGCGYFDLGLLLSECPQVVVDGFEPDSTSAMLGNQRCQERLPRSKIYPTSESIPNHYFDFVTLNSVTQYFVDTSELKRVLEAAKRYLNPESLFSELIITDIIPQKYSRLKDLFFSLWDALFQGILLDMLKHILSVLRQKHHQKYFQIDADQFIALASSLGFKSQILSQNLSPSRFRYTLHLTLKDKLLT